MNIQRQELKSSLVWALVLFLPITGLGMVLVRASHSEGFLGLLSAVFALPGAVVSQYVSLIPGIPEWVVWGLFTITQLLYLVVLVFVLRIFNRRVDRFAQKVANQK